MVFKKLTVNVGEVEIFVEVYECDENFKPAIGDIKFTEENDNLVREVWNGDKWEFTPDLTGIENVVFYTAFEVDKEPIGKVVRILNKNPFFNKEEYLKENV